MPAVSALASLTRLDLFGARITDGGVSYLRTLTSLRHIELCGGGITDVGVGALAALPELRSLNISQNIGVTDSGVNHLCVLPVLESLNLSYTKVTIGCFAPLKLMASLTSLSLYGCHIPAKAVASLRGSLRHLQSLGYDP